MLEYQNDKLKQFKLDQSLLLQETNKIFKLYTLSIYILAEIRKVMN